MAFTTFIALMAFITCTVFMDFIALGRKRR